MKLKSQPNQPSTATVDDLQRQRAELLRAQTEAHARLDSADPLDWRATSAANSDLQAIGSAIQAIDRKIDIARGDLARSTAAERETAQYEQRQAALSGAAAVTAVVVDALQALDRGAFSALDSAVDALAVAGATSPPYTFPAIVELRRAVTATLGRLAQLDPPLLGLPPHPTAEALRIAEARRAVETAEATLAEVSRISYGGEGRALAVERAGEGLRLAQKRLSALTGESYTVQALQSRIARMVSTVPMRQPDEVFP